MEMSWGYEPRSRAIHAAACNFIKWKYLKMQSFKAVGIRPAIFLACKLYISLNFTKQRYPSHQELINERIETGQEQKILI